VCVLVVPILFIRNPKQGKSAGGDERCRSSNNNNTYNEGEGGSNNSTCSEGGCSSTCSEVTTTLAIKVEVAEKKRRVKLPKLK
jgi:hypothetical protein